MAAGGKKKKRRTEYAAGGGGRRKPLGRSKRMDISDFVGEGWDLDACILLCAVILNAILLSAASVFWTLYATCGCGVPASTTEQTTTSVVTPPSTTAPPPPPPSSTTTKMPSPVTEPVAEPVQPNWTFECGVPEIKPDLKKGRIVGGAEAVPHSWPYTVGLGRVESSMVFQPCGATLLSPKHALSAASCFREDLDIKLTYTIFARMHDKRGWKGVLFKEIETVHVHPLNNLASGNPYLQYDFAVLTLVEELEPETGVNFACLPALRVEKPEGTICWGVGWGKTQGTGSDGLLKQLAIDIVSHKTCDLKFIADNVKESTFCAGTTPDEITCYGDGGGPLYCFDDGKWTVFGVTSYGPKICGMGPMAAFGAVSFNIEWICCYTPGIPSCAGIKCVRSGENRE